MRPRHLPHQVLQLHPRERIQRRERLIQQQHPRPRVERPRDRGPLRLTAGQLTRQRFLQSGQSDLLEQPPHPGFVMPLPEIEPDVLRHGQPREQPWFLEDDPDVPIRPPPRPPAEPDLAAEIGIEPGHDAQQRALAAAARADQREHLPRRQREADVGQHRRFARRGLCPATLAIPANLAGRADHAGRTGESLRPHLHFEHAHAGPPKLSRQCSARCSTVAIRLSVSLPSRASSTIAASTRSARPVSRPSVSR